MGIADLCNVEFLTIVQLNFDVLGIPILSQELSFLPQKLLLVLRSKYRCSVGTTLCSALENMQRL